MRPLPSRPITSGQALLAAGLIAICCGGPLLIAALAATGIGAWLLGDGAMAPAALALLVVVLAALWLRHGRLSSLSQVDDCCAPAAARGQEKP